MYELRFFDDRLRCHREQCGRNVIDGHDIENQIFIGGEFILSVQSEKDQRRCGIESFIPSRERIGEGAFYDCRTDDCARNTGFSGNELLAHAFCVRIDPGPAPPFSALESEIAHAGADPVFPLSSCCEIQGAFVIGIASFFSQTLPGGYAEFGVQSCIGCFFYNTPDQAIAVYNFLIHAEPYIL